MKFNKKLWFLISGLIALAGAILLVVGLALGGKPDFIISSKGILTDKNFIVYEKEKTTVPSFNAINIEGVPCKVFIEEGDEFQIEYALTKADGEPIINIEDNRLDLQFDSQDAGISFVQFNLFLPSNYIKIWVPKGTVLDNVEIFSNSGDSKLEGINAKEIHLENNYGNIIFNDTITESLFITTISGNTKLKRITSENLTIVNQFGEVVGSEIQSDNIQIESVSGDCKIVNVDVNHLNITGKFSEINVHLIDKEPDYDFDLATTFGEIYLNKSEKNKEYKDIQSREKDIQVKNSNGDIIIKTN